MGNPVYGPLFIRITLGLYFILAGEAKLHVGRSFVEEVKAYGVLPQHAAEVYGTLLPFVEMFAGGLLLLGLWTTLAALLTSLMLLSFIIALGPFAHRPFNKDIILLACSLALLFLGSGAISIDRFRKTG